MTENKQIEESLRVNEERYRILMASLSEGIMLKDRSGTIIACNQAAQTIFGMSEKDILGETSVSRDWDMFQEDGTPFPEPEHPSIQTLSTGQPGVNQVMGFRRIRDGHWIWLNVNTQPVCTLGREKPDAVVISFSDITERKRVEEELRNSERELRWLFKSMINAFAIHESVFDDSGCFVSFRFYYFNEAYQRILGVNLDAIKGKTVQDIWPGTEDEWIKRYEEVAVTGIPQTFDLYHTPTDKIYHCNAYRPWDSPHRFCVVFEDITERMRTEKRERYLKQLLLAMRNLNQLIVQEDDPHRLIQHACEILAETLGNSNAWIALFDDAGTISGIAQAGFDGDFIQLQDLLVKSVLPRCIWQSGGRDEVVVKTPQIECPECPLSGQYRDRSCLVGRLTFGENRFGVLVITTDTWFAHDQELRDLFAELAGDLSFALYKIHSAEVYRLVEERYRHLVENAGEGIIVVQGDRCVFVNPALSDITGQDATELLSQPFLDFLHPEDRAMFWERSTAVLSKREKLLRYPMRIITREGAVGWIELNAVPIEWEGYPAILGLIQDITARKLTEDRLRESEEQYRLLAENTLDVIWKMDLDTRFSYVNAAVEDMFGFTPDELVGTRLSEHCDEEEMQKIADLIAHELARPREHSGVIYESVMKRKDGRPITVDIHARLLFDEKYQPIGIQGITRDISERKKVEQRIRHLSYHDSLTDLYNRVYIEEELNRLSESRWLPMGIMLCDVNGLKLVNNAFGHREGDRLLVRLAQVLRESCRQEDLIGRWGGDEFIILLPRSDEKVLQEVADRIESYCGQASNEPILLLLSVSFGWVTKTDPEQPYVALIAQAEERMYRYKLTESRSARSTIITSLEQSLWETTQETQEHAIRMNELVLQVGRSLLLSTDDLNNLGLLARLHDLGKIAIPKDVLNKPCPLSQEEWKVVRKHPEIGYRIAESSPDLLPIAEAILTHHEWWDGSGYPRGLSGQHIPLLARILSVVDAFDVMINGRPYKNPISHSQAIGELKRCAGTQFDPGVVDVFVGTIGGSRHLP